MLTRRKFAFRVNNLRSFLALSFCLARHSTLHRLRQLEIAHLDAGDLHAPRTGLRINHLLELGVDLVPLGQQMIEVGLAQNAPQRCLADQRRCAHVIEHLDYRLFGIDYPEIDDRVDFHRHVVASDGLLRWDLERDDA